MYFDKRYNTVNYHLKTKFGRKVAKIPLDAGFTCPTRDGTLGVGGCIFCSEHGSGDFTANHNFGFDTSEAILSITQQIEFMKKIMNNKWKNSLFIPYFQAYTNTYAPVDVLERLYYQALRSDGVCGIAIATRPDCLDNDVLSLLDEINKKTYLFVELGLQTSNESSVKFINRGFDNECFNKSVNNLQKLNIEAVAHIILGLPNETKYDMLKTVNFAVKSGINGVKLQMLHIIKGTKLHEIYLHENFALLDFAEYVEIMADIIERLPPEIVVHRITGDGDKKNLIAPLWSTNKKAVINGLDNLLKSRGTYQGSCGNFRYNI